MGEIWAISVELKRNISDIMSAENSEKAKFAFAELKINVEKALTIASIVRDTDKLRADWLIIEAKRALMIGINAMTERSCTEPPREKEKEETEKQTPRRRFSFFNIFGKKFGSFVSNAVAKHNNNHNNHKQ